MQQTFSCETNLILLDKFIHAIQCAKDIFHQIPVKVTPFGFGMIGIEIAQKDGQYTLHPSDEQKYEYLISQNFFSNLLFQ